MKERSLALQLTGILFLTALLIISIPSVATAQTADNREALLDYLIDKTLEREAVSLIKQQAMDMDFALQANALRQEYRDADTDLKMERVLRKTMGIVRDSHLRIEDIGGVPLTTSYSTLPLLIAPDFGNDPASNNFDFFVYSKQPGYTFNESINVGDRLVEINGIPISDYYEKLNKFFTHSSRRKLAWVTADWMSATAAWYPDDIRPSSNQPVPFVFKRKDGSEYATTVQFNGSGNYSQSVSDYDVTQNGYEYRVGTEHFSLFYHPVRDKVLIKWLSGDDITQTDVMRIINFLKDNNQLDGDIIFYDTFATGGKGNQYVPSALCAYPYKTTFGKVKHSDISDDYAENSSNAREDWIMRNAGTGAEYSNAAPRKLFYFDEFEDGIWHTLTGDQEADRFRGNVVAVFSSRVGSNNDQMSATIIQNGVAYSMGNPTGGYSKTGEWEEDLKYPGHGGDVVGWMWNIGHTLGPDGVVLEGNPTPVDDYYSMTYLNSETYWSDLIDRAEDYLENHPGQKPEVFLEDWEISSGTRIDNGEEFTVEISSEYQGVIDNPDLRIGVYISEDNMFNRSEDVKIASFATNLHSGQKEKVETLDLTMPCSDDVGTGFKFIMFNADDWNTVAERSEWNNTRFERIQIQSDNSCDHTIGIMPTASAAPVQVYQRGQPGTYILEWRPPTAQALELSVRNLKGQIVSQKKLPKSKIFRVEIILSDRPDGVYFLWARAGKVKRVHKLVKHK